MGIDLIIAAVVSAQGLEPCTQDVPEASCYWHTEDSHGDHHLITTDENGNQVYVIIEQK